MSTQMEVPVHPLLAAAGMDDLELRRRAFLVGCKVLFTDRGVKAEKHLKLMVRPGLAALWHRGNKRSHSTIIF